MAYGTCACKPFQHSVTAKGGPGASLCTSVLERECIIGSPSNGPLPFDTIQTRPMGEWPATRDDIRLGGPCAEAELVPYKLE